MSEERKKISLTKALKMIPNGIVHTFRNPQGGIFIGTDWSRGQIEKYMRENKATIELSGELATRMDHALVLKDEAGFLFIQTKKPQPDR